MLRFHSDLAGVSMSPFRNAARRILAGSFIVFAPIVSAAHPNHASPSVQVAILLFDGVQIIDFAAPYEVFGQARFGVYTMSADGKPVTTAMGLQVTPDHRFADAPPADVLLVPGGDVDAVSQHADTLAFVRERAARASHVLSVCTGAQILAATGMLDGKRATTFHRAFDSLAEAYPDVTVVRDARWVDSGRVVTSAGLSSGIDAALHIVALLRGEEFARSTALHLEYDWQPDGGFVRGILADRWLPPLADIRWPENTRFERVLSLGDATSWRMTFDVVTDATPRQLLGLIDAGMASSEGWSEVSGAPHRWQAEIDGAPRILDFSTTAGEPMKLELRLTSGVDVPTKSE